MTERKTNTRTVKTEDLQIGMFVTDAGTNWLQHPWVTRKKKITSRAEVQQLLDYGISEVLVDLDRSDLPGCLSEPEHGLSARAVKTALKVPIEEVVRTVATPVSGQPLSSVERRKRPRPEQPLDNIPLEEELPAAGKIYSQALSVVHDVIDSIKSGQKIRLPHVRDCIEEMIDSVFRNRHALSTLFKLKTYDEYTFTHSLNVSVMALSVGRQFSFSRDQLLNLGLGAMLHDVGKTAIPDEILNKPGKLTPQEFEVMKKHPELGVKIVEAQGLDLPGTVIGIIRHHHEKTNGLGYPKGLREGEIDPFMTIVALSDIYDALSSDRVYHKGMMPHEALKVLFSLRGKEFSPIWVERFIHCTGIYPPGSMVLLNTGEMALVSQVNHACLTRPNVMVVMDAKSRQLPLRQNIDLNTMAFKDVEIVSIVDHRQAGIDPSLFLNAS